MGLTAGSARVRSLFRCPQASTTEIYSIPNFSDPRGHHGGFLAFGSRDLESHDPVAMLPRQYRRHQDLHHRHQSAQYQLHSLPTGAHGPGCIPSNFAAGLRIASWLSAQGIWNLMTRWLCSLANIGDTKTYTMLTGPSDLRILAREHSHRVMRFQIP
jgi:hypothetical protein